MYRLSDRWGVATEPGSKSRARVRVIGLVLGLGPV